MSHKTVYMGISANKLKGSVSLENISAYVEKTMRKYVEETAKEENIKCDWYVIGGRWEGAVGAVKGTENILLTENGLFAYQLFDQYDAIINNGQRGPYFVDDVEYIPVNAGLKKDIAAVKNAISDSINSGFVEGNNNKIKLIKRIVYGKQKLVNLFKRCYLAFASTLEDLSLLKIAISSLI